MISSSPTMSSRPQRPLPRSRVAPRPPTTEQGRPALRTGSPQEGSPIVVRPQSRAPSVHGMAPDMRADGPTAIYRPNYPYMQRTSVARVCSLPSALSAYSQPSRSPFADFLLSPNVGSSSAPSPHDVSGSSPGASSVADQSSSRQPGPPSLETPPAPQQATDGSHASSVQEADSDSNSVPTINYRFGGTPQRMRGKLAGGTGINTWIEYVHLDGSVYYYDKLRAIVTPDDVQQRPVLDALEKALKNIDVFPTGNFDTVIKGLCGESGPTVYFVDHDRGLYLEPIKSRADPKYTDPKFHMEERTERYWRHLQAYPMHLSRLPAIAEPEFLGALAFGSSERILEWTETPFPFSAHQAKRLLEVYEALREAALHGRPVVPAQAWHIARAMARIEVSRREVKHGTPQCSMYRKVAVKPARWQVRVADLGLVFLLFGVQRMYRLRLESVRVKGVVYPPDLRELFENFLAEWSDSNLLATVFVGANIGFLALPGATSIQRTASLASAIFAITSVGSGMHHVWQHRTKVDTSPEEAHAYLSHADAAGADIELAIMSCFLSVPVSSLLWSILCFTVAIGALCIQSTDVHGEILLAVVLGVLGLLCAATLLFFWHMWRGTRREEIQEEEEWSIIVQGWKWALKQWWRETREMVKRK